MHNEYWVKYKGRVHGPFTISQLRSGLKRGKISRSHGISTNRRTWQSLGDVLAELEATPSPPPTLGAAADPFAEQPSRLKPDVPLAPRASGQPFGGGHPPPTPFAEAQQTPIAADPRFQDPRAVLEAHSGSIMVQLLIGGIAIVLALALPVSAVGRGRFEWVWTNFDRMPGGLQFGLISSAVIGIGMIALSVSTRGLARSIPIVSALLLSGLIGFVTLMNEASRESSEFVAGVVLGMAGVLSCVSLLATAKWRAIGPTATRRTLTCIAGSVLSLSCLIWIILLLSVLIEEGLPPTREVPSVFPIVFVALSFAGLGLGLTGGIFGIVQANPAASASSNKVSQLFARLCLATLFALLGGVGAIGAWQAARLTGTHSLFPMLLIVFQACILPLLYLPLESSTGLK